MSAVAKNVYPGNSPNKSIYKIMEECSLSEEEESKLQNYVQKKKMIFISTPFSRKAVDRLIKMKVPKKTSGQILIKKMKKDLKNLSYGIKIMKIIIHLK